VRRAWQALVTGRIEATFDFRSEDCVFEDFPEMPDSAVSLTLLVGLKHGQVKSRPKAIRCAIVGFIGLYAMNPTITAAAGAAPASLGALLHPNEMREGARSTWAETV
jgi:hypothetical protein